MLITRIYFSLGEEAAVRQRYESLDFGSMHVSMIYSNKYALRHEAADNERRSGRMTGCDEMAKTAIVTLPSPRVRLSLFRFLFCFFPDKFLSPFNAHDLLSR